MISTACRWEAIVNSRELHVVPAVETGVDVVVDASVFGQGDRGDRVQSAVHRGFDRGDCGDCDEIRRPSWLRLWRR